MKPRADCVPASNFRTKHRKIRKLTIKNTHPKLCRLLGVFRYRLINNSFNANLFQSLSGKLISVFRFVSEKRTSSNSHESSPDTK